MTGSIPPRRRRFRKREAEDGPSDGTYEAERGPMASLESPEGLPGPSGSPRDHGAPLVPAPPDEAATAPAGAARRRMAAVGNGVRGAAQRSAGSARASLAYLADRVISLAPRLPVRDLAALRKQFPGLDADQIADRLINAASYATSGVGAGIGAAAMMPVPPAMPTELAAEISAVAAIELKLIAELHEVYGLRPPGNLTQRTYVYLACWSEERGVDVRKPSTLNAAVGGSMKRELRQRIMKRMVRNLPNLMPFMVGAAVGAVMNRRETRKLAHRIRKDLGAVRIPWEQLDPLPPLDLPADLISPEELGELPPGR